MSRHMGRTTNEHRIFSVVSLQRLFASIDKQLSRAVKSSPSYHLTFSLVTASGAPSSWDIQSLLNSHIEPLRKALESVTDINIASQVQLYSSYSPSIQPFQVEGQDVSFLRQNDLTAFVNAAEWPLSPSIGAGPTLNFIIYVSALDQLPLEIEEGRGQSWLVPSGVAYISSTPLSWIIPSGARLCRSTCRATTCHRPSRRSHPSCCL